MRKLIFLLSIFLFALNSKSNFVIGHETDTTARKDSLITITISAVGDLMCHSVEFDYARVSPDSFDFNPFYSEIKPFLEKSDFTLGNLETVISSNSKKYSGYPYFNSPDEFLDPLKNTGFDLITTANNHALDQGEKGTIRTIEELKKYNLNYEGTFLSQSDRDSIRVFNIKGIRTAFLAYTYGTNGNVIPKGKSYLINVIDTTLIREDIQSARTKGAEIVIVYFHFGKEYDRYPTKYQQEIVNKTINYGADIILGGHPHVIQPVKFFKTVRAKLDTGFVAYSLGNFLSNQRWRYSDAGTILTIHLTKNISKDSIYISKVTYLPTWVYKGEINQKNEYLILPAQINPADSALTFLNESDKLKMNQAFNDTKNILTKYTHNIFLQSLKNFSPLSKILQK